jgi:carbonic anhydrase
VCAASLCLWLQRLETGRLAGLKEGDAHVIRNAGGRVHEAIRSLAISQQLLGTEEVVIIHHTDCGMLTFTDQQLHDKFRQQHIDSSHIAWLSFTELEQSVKDDIAVYHSSPLLRQDVPVRGFIYDVKTGKLNEVSAK